MNTQNIKETTVFDGAVVGKCKDLEVTKKLYFKLTAWHSTSQLWINKVAVEMMTRCKYWIWFCSMPSRICLNHYLSWNITFNFLKNTACYVIKNANLHCTCHFPSDWNRELKNHFANPASSPPVPPWGQQAEDPALGPSSAPSQLPRSGVRGLPRKTRCVREEKAT